MKNIHIIQTDKPSRLSILNNGKLNFGAEFISSSNSKAQNIYITNDEEIKDADWFLYNNNSISKSYKLFHVKFDNPKKIILTTDQDLIKDGVQAIDDEFLEWFVKNPSCEYVEVDKGYRGIGLFNYKIIIPKEKPKQETLEEFAEKLTNDFPALEVRFNMSTEEIYGWFLEALQKGAKWQKERIQNLRDELYNQLPTGEVNAFNLIKIINSHIKKLDELI